MLIYHTRLKNIAITYFLATLAILDTKIAITLYIDQARGYEGLSDFTAWTLNPNQSTALDPSCISHHLYESTDGYCAPL